MKQIALALLFALGTLVAGCSKKNDPQPTEPGGGATGLSRITIGF
jgi:hypothetical protein